MPVSEQVNAAAERYATRFSYPDYHASMMFDDDRRTLADYACRRIAEEQEGQQRADSAWLEEQGFKWESDGSALVFKTNGPEIICSIVTNERSDDWSLATSLSIHWEYRDSTPKVGLHYAIDDNPTRAQVLRLLAALTEEPRALPSSDPAWALLGCTHSQSLES